MNKSAIINDTHWGARNDDQNFADYFKKFYDGVFFPTLIERGIKRIFHLGDIVDRRKYINFVTAKRLREDFIEKCVEYGIELHIILGNHDVYYKNTNEVNSMAELYSGRYPNVYIYEKPYEYDSNGVKILFMPWICSGNYQEAMDAIANTKAQILLGHLELQGFEMYKGTVNEHGFETFIFDKFDFVGTGHFHHKSDRGNIHYFGAPYEITWSDFNDDRGFHIFDADTRTVEYIRNPYKMFYKINYDDEGKTTEEILDIPYEDYRGTFVKIVVRNKTNPYCFDMVIDRLEKAGVLDLKVVDDHFHADVENDQEILDEAEDTLTILKSYVSQLDIKGNKPKLEQLLRELYQDALNV